VLSALERLHAGRVAEVAETLAFHAVRAEAWEQAVDHLRVVAGRAYERGAPGRPWSDWSWRSISAPEALGMRPLVARAHLRRGQLWQRMARADHGREHLAVAARMLEEMDMRYWRGAT
jgi:hypothetical protein